MIAKAQEFAAACSEIQDKLADLGLVADDAAVMFGTFAGRVNDASDAMARASAAADAAADAMTSDAEAAALAAAGIADMDDKLTDLIVLSTASVSELHDVRDALLGVAVADVTAAAATSAAGAKTDAAAAATWGLSAALSGQIPLLSNVGAGFWGLSTHVTLFGGALGTLPLLGTVSVMHILADTVVEVLGTLIPATSAIIAFGVAGFDTGQEIYERFLDLNLVTDALGQNLYPLTGNFSKLANAVQPEVYVLFGEGLELVTKKTGEFSEIAEEAGSVVDQLGARFVVAIDNGDGLNKFLGDSIGDLQGWGDVVENVGGILGTVFRALPGYAQYFLDILQGVTGFAETLAMAIEPVINWGLALHGAILWGGLFVTAVFAMRGPLMSLITAITAVNTALGAYVGSIVMAEGFTATATAVFAPLVEMLSNPLVWGTLAVGGLIALGVALANTSNAAESFGKSLTNAIESATPDELTSVIGAALQEAQEKVTQSSQAVTQAATQQQAAVGGAASRFESSYNPAVDDAVTANQAYIGVQQQVSDTSTTVEGHLIQLATRYGGLNNAMNLVNAAQITTAQLTTTNANTWQQAETEIAGYNDSLKAMTDGTGEYAAILNALSGPQQYLGDFLKSDTTDAQALAAVMTNLTSGLTNLDTFEQGMATLATDAQAAGASINGTNTASYALNEQFQSQLNSAQSIIGSLVEQEASYGQLTTAVATTAGQMEQFTGATGANATEIVDYINNSLGPGTVSLQTLNQWIGKNSTSLSGLNTIVGESATKAGALSNLLTGQLNQAEADGITNAAGLTTAFQNMATSAYDSDYNLSAMEPSAAAVAEALYKATGSASAAQTQFMTFATQGLGLTQQQANILWQQVVPDLTKTIEGVPTSWNTNFTTNLNTGTSPVGPVNEYEYELDNIPKSITTYLNVQTAGTSASQILGALGQGSGATGSRTSKASGGYIHGPGTGTSDSIHAMLSRGEYVMKASAVDYWGRDFMHAVNAKGHAAGGTAGSPGLVPQVIEAAYGGGTGAGVVHLHNQTQVNVGSRKILSEVRSAQLSYERRNPSSGWSLGRQATPR